MPNEALADGKACMIKRIMTADILQAEALRNEGKFQGRHPEELSRDTVDEHLAAGGDGGINDANRTLKITEHYIRIDFEQNGKIKLYRITTGGEQGEKAARPRTATGNSVNVAYQFERLGGAVESNQPQGRCLACTRS
jgi:hypothetical protein